jgi:serine/threonine protein phosphatase PrpC
MKKPDIEIAGKTDTGLVRERNEDSIAIDAELGLLVVADGMGGHNSGEVASGLAADTILEFARKMLGGDKSETPEGDKSLSVRGRQVKHFIATANSVIWEKSRAFPKDQGMGTTVVVALADENSVSVGHVGDSRLYRLRAGELELLTEDHSLVMDQVKHGLLTMEQADKSHLQNILTRALGTEENVEIDVEDHALKPGDILLICSDGLTKMVTDKEAEKVLCEMATPEEGVDTLIRMSRDGGGVDNITVAIVRIPDGKPRPAGFFKRLFGG